MGSQSIQLKRNNQKIIGQTFSYYHVKTIWPKMSSNEQLQLNRRIFACQRNGAGGELGENKQSWANIVFCEVRKTFSCVRENILLSVRENILFCEGKHSLLGGKNILVCEENILFCEGKYSLV